MDSKSKQKKKITYGDLDDYEKELFHSDDEADKLALKIRLEMKQKGIDPDKDPWHVKDMHTDYGSNEDVTVEECYATTQRVDADT